MEKKERKTKIKRTSKGTDLEEMEISLNLRPILFHKKASDVGLSMFTLISVCAQSFKNVAFICMPGLAVGFVILTLLFRFYFSL